MSDGIKFNWGLSGVAGDRTGAKGILLEPGMICYRGRNGLPFRHRTAADSVSHGFTIGGEADCIDITANGSGVLTNSPMKNLYLARESSGVVEFGLIYNLYIEYDIVTLTTAEQADLYQKGLCS